MKAFVLAAGRGMRLRPLTDSLPKPLLEAGGRTLVEHHLVRLRRAGVTEIVMNVHHLGDMIEAHLGDGHQLGVSIRYSREQSLLETGGGIRRALPLLGEEPFVVVSADTYLDIDMGVLGGSLPPDCLGRLLMTTNPAHHPEGDFAVDASGNLSHQGEKLTYTGAGLISPALVADHPEEAFKLRVVLDPAVAAGRIQGVRHDGYWCDAGTMERLDALRRRLSG